MGIIVICENCGAVCPSKWENGVQVWLWQGRKCENCGSEAWVSHDPQRNWKTGKIEAGKPDAIYPE